MKNKKLFAILTLVCFMMTLMPVAAFAADTVADTSVLYLTAEDTVVAEGDKVSFEFTACDNAGEANEGANGYLYIWAKDADGRISSALDVENTVATATAPQYAKVIKVEDAVTAFEVSFAREGEYTVYAAFSATADVTKVSDLTPAKGVAEDVITVLGDNVDPSVAYDMGLALGTKVFKKQNVDTKGYDYIINNVKPNNVSDKYTLTFTNNGKALVGKTVTIETDSDNIFVSQDKEKTNYAGQVKFDLAASREGEYTIYVTVDGVEFIIAVDCTNTQAAYIETTQEPEALVAQFTSGANFDDVVFTITDINGNAVTNAAKAGGAKNLYNGNAKYLFFVEKPAASKLKDANLSLNEANENGEYTLSIDGTLDAEGVYTVKAILDNGAFATATWEVKRFQAPVELRIKAASTVELGKRLAPELEYVDANGVVKEATDAKLAATGYAIYSFDKKGVITLKTDEKYAGQTITLTAVSERYDLVTVKEVKIAAEATDIAFAEKSLAVDVNNKVVWNVVDADGNVVRLNDVANVKVKYVVLDKPADAKVSVYDLTDKDFDGEGKMAITSNKVGNVTVQAIAQVQVAQNGKEAVQTKYYTGTQIFAVGTEGVGDVVVMSVGSNEIVINDAKATIDAAPIVKNDRTFVPFRALAEAFGAEVAFDEATQAVTAELNGVKVVMTIGSATYTVNGAEKTADVAPFINGSRTMVPVRFAAEAFGIKVIPTYDENGATADILFNL